MSLVLALDTATEQVAVGLGRLSDAGLLEVLGTHDEHAPRSAMSRLMPAVDALLRASGIAPGEIDAVVAGRGPGSFTGVRIGVATAKGLARGAGAALYGVGTLDAVARRLADHEGLVGVVGDAMRGEVYPALFRCGGGGVERLGADTVSLPGTAAAAWAALGEPVLLSGNGLAKHGASFAEALGDAASWADEAMWPPTGAALLETFAAAGPSEAGAGDPGALLPVYTRLSDAEERERLAGGCGAFAPDSGVAGPGGGAA